MATGTQFPQQFGRYYLTQKIAMGGMAEIFRAKSVGAEGFEKVVVIKRILPHFSEDEGFVTMFKDEARVAAHLAHANVVQVFDFDEVDHLFYIAMEYVEGRDLKRVLDVGAREQKPMSIAQSVFVLIEAAQGLHYAHSRVVDGQPLGIIHRDVSPHNVMISFSGEVKIMDFGIAKAASRSTKTRVGTVKGKCAYMSPEQARGKPLDPRSDLFALGVLLWEMLTGKRLFVGESDFETLNNVLKAEVPAPSELNPEVPKELDAIVLKALAREREGRQADTGQFASELRRWFYSSVPDPDAVNLKGYMHDLFEEEIEQLRTEVAAEAQQMEGVRRGTGSSSAPKRSGTGSNAAAVASDEERTMALDGSGLPADADRTMALPDAAAFLESRQPSGSRRKTMAMTEPPLPPKKSRTGLFVGVGLLVAAIAAAGGVIGLRGKPAPATNADGAAVQASAAVAPHARKFQLTIKAPGANQILVNDSLVSTDPETTYVGEQGATVRIQAKNGDRVKLVHHVIQADEVVDIQLPEAPKPVEPVKVEAAAPIVIVQVEPQSATLLVNGAPMELTKGNAKVPNLKLGDTFKVDAKADGYKSESKTFMVKNAQLETFEIALQRDRPAGPKPEAAEKAGPGKVVITAKPWAKVSEKGKDLGLTPAKADVQSGKHTFTLTKGSVTKTVTLTVKAGQTATANVDMSAE